MYKYFKSTLFTKVLASLQFCPRSSSPPSLTIVYFYKLIFLEVKLVTTFPTNSLCSHKSSRSCWTRMLFLLGILISCEVVKLNHLYRKGWGGWGWWGLDGKGLSTVQVQGDPEISTQRLVYLEASSSWCLSQN